MSSKTKLDPNRNYNRRNSPYFIQTIGKSDEEIATAIRAVFNARAYEQSVMECGLAEKKRQQATEEVA